MTDYWKSNERHYCKHCNVWMQGDKGSIRHHEQGRKHRDMVENTLKQKRKAKSDAAYAERDLQQQLREIERTAQAKFAQDLAGQGLPPAPPPPPSTRRQQPKPDGGPRSRREDARAGSMEHRAHTEEEPDDGAVESTPEDDSGVYAVRGTVYLEGKKHEDQLLEGSACQIWVEEDEAWLDALIESATVHEIPNTALVFRRFVITYLRPGETEPTTERDLRSDRLRIKLPEDMTIEDAERMLERLRKGEAATIEEAHVPVDQTTGMGEWSTVVVREIDESDEAVAQREAAEAAEMARVAEDERRKEALEDFSGQGDNALGAFNPWGGSYKGVDLENDSASARQAREEEIMIRTDKDVGFKKRRATTDGEGSTKGPAQKKKKQRRIRAADEDE